MQTQVSSHFLEALVRAIATYPKPVDADTVSKIALNGDRPEWETFIYNLVSKDKEELSQIFYDLTGHSIYFDDNPPEKIPPFDRWLAIQEYWVARNLKSLESRKTWKEVPLDWIE